MNFFPRLCLITLTIALVSNVSACGQKGPLYLPAKPPAVSTPYPVSEPEENTKESTPTKKSE